VRDHITAGTTVHTTAGPGAPIAVAYELLADGCKHLGGAGLSAVICVLNKATAGREAFSQKRRVCIICCVENHVVSPALPNSCVGPHSLVTAASGLRT
jgi:hypothetical protein